MQATRHLVAAAAAALFSAGTATAAPAAPATAGAAAAPSLETLRSALPKSMKARAPGVLQTYLKLRGQTPAPETDSQPDEARGDPALAPVVLPQVLATVDTALSTAPTAMTGALQAARNAYASARDQIHAGAPDSSQLFLVGVLQAMATGQAGLDQALDIAAAVDPGQVSLLLPAVQKVREAAARMSQSQIDLALAAGVSSGRLAPAQEAMRVANALHEGGDYGGGAAQYANAFGLAANTVVFSLDRFEQNLRSVFDSQTVGYSYALSQGGQLVRQKGVGEARTGADLPATGQSSSKKMHVASVSKTMTAIVMLRALSDLGLSPDNAIGGHLPAGWTRGNGVNSITFRQLLTHKSGFGQTAPTGSAYDNLRAMVGQAVPSKGSFSYTNANFGLMRVLIANLLGADTIGLPLDMAAYTTAVFMNYAQARFDTVGVPFSCEPSANAPTLQYDFPDTGNPGYVEPSRSLQCGGFGVTMSAQNLARSMAYLRYTQDLMPATRFQQMKTGFLGFMDPARYDFAQGTFGVYHTHGGDWDHPGFGGLDACVMMFPINVEATVLINSSRKASGIGYSNGGYQCKVVKWAFENAWAAK